MFDWACSIAKAAHLESLERALVGAWNPKFPVQLKKIGEDRILFNFSSESEKKKIMNRSPWAFDKNLVVLRELEAGEDPSTVSLDWCAFYMHATGVPYTLLHEGMAKVLGDALGSFVSMDSAPQKGYSGSVLRFRARVNVTKPLRRIISAMGPVN